MAGEVLLRVDRLSVSGRGKGQALSGVTFDVRAGEIVGIAGIEGNGQTELIEILASSNTNLRSSVPLLLQNGMKKIPSTWQPTTIVTN